MSLLVIFPFWVVMSMFQQGQCNYEETVSCSKGYGCLGNLSIAQHSIQSVPYYPGDWKANCDSNSDESCLVNVFNLYNSTSSLSRIVGNDHLLFNLVRLYREGSLTLVVKVEDASPVEYVLGWNSTTLKRQFPLLDIYHFVLQLAHLAGDDVAMDTIVSLLTEAIESTDPLTIY